MKSILLVVLAVVVAAVVVGLVVGAVARGRRPRDSSGELPEDRSRPLEPGGATSTEPPDDAPSSDDRARPGEPTTDAGDLEDADAGQEPEPEAEAEPEEPGPIVTVAVDAPAGGEDAVLVEDEAQDDDQAPDDDEAQDEDAVLVEDEAQDDLAWDDGSEEPAVEHPPPATLRPVAIGALSLADLGVAPDALAAPGEHLDYVPRDVDAALDAALQRQHLDHVGDLLVVRGGPSSGLTRSAVEALRRAGRHRPTVVVPVPAALPSTFEEAQPFAAFVEQVLEGVSVPPDVIVFVDRAQEHLGRGLTFEHVAELLAHVPAATVVATLDAHRLDVPEIVGDLTESWLRRVCEGNDVASVLSPAEIDRASVLLDVTGELSALPSRCAASDVLRERYVQGLTDEPVGTAIVAAAVGWRRTVLRTTVPREALFDLARQVLVRRGLPAASDEDVAEGLRWATEEVVPGHALLCVVDGDLEAVMAASSVVAEVAALDPPIDEAFLGALLEHLAGVEALDVARVRAASGELDDAVRALVEAGGSGDEHVRATAALQLGVLEEGRGRTAEAEAAYRRAANTQDDDVAPIGALHLGGVLELADRLDEAATAYRHAIASGHAEAAPQAALNLGWMMQHRRQPDEAVDAYEIAVTSDHPAIAPQAAYNLASLYERQRRHQDAEIVYREAMASGHPDIAPMATVSLGLLLERMRRGREAEDLYRRAEQSGHDEAAEAARVRLRTMHR